MPEEVYCAFLLSKHPERKTRVKLFSPANRALWKHFGRLVRNDKCHAVKLGDAETYYHDEIISCKHCSWYSVLFQSTIGLCESQMMSHLEKKHKRSRKAIDGARSSAKQQGSHNSPSTKTTKRSADKNLSNKCVSGTSTKKQKLNKELFNGIQLPSPSATSNVSEKFADVVISAPLLFGPPNNEPHNLVSDSMEPKSSNEKHENSVKNICLESFNTYNINLYKLLHEQFDSLTLTIDMWESKDQRPYWWMGYWTMGILVTGINNVTLKCDTFVLNFSRVESGLDSLRLAHHIFKVLCQFNLLFKVNNIIAGFSANIEKIMDTLKLLIRNHLTNLGFKASDLNQLMRFNGRRSLHPNLSVLIDETVRVLLANLTNNEYLATSPLPRGATDPRDLLFIPDSWYGSSDEEGDIYENPSAVGFLSGFRGYFSEEFEPLYLLNQIDTINKKPDDSPISDDVNGFYVQKFILSDVADAIGRQRSLVQYITQIKEGRKRWVELHTRLNVVRTKVQIAVPSNWKSLHKMLTACLEDRAQVESYADLHLKEENVPGYQVNDDILERDMLLLKALCGLLDPLSMISEVASNQNSLPDISFQIFHSLKKVLEKNSSNPSINLSTDEDLGVINYSEQDILNAFSTGFSKTMNFLKGYLDSPMITHFLISALLDPLQKNTIQDIIGRGEYKFQGKDSGKKFCRNSWESITEEMKAMIKQELLNSWNKDELLSHIRENQSNQQLDEPPKTFTGISFSRKGLDLVKGFCEANRIDSQTTLSSDVFKRGSDFFQLRIFQSPKNNINWRDFLGNDFAPNSSRKPNPVITVESASINIDTLHPSVLAEVENTVFNGKSTFESKIGSDIEAEIDDYMRDTWFRFEDDRPQYSALSDYWSQTGNQELYPHLFLLAKRMFSINTSNENMERLLTGAKATFGNRDRSNALQAMRTLQYNIGSSSKIPYSHLILEENDYHLSNSSATPPHVYSLLDALKETQRKIIDELKITDIASKPVEKKTAAPTLDDLVAEWTKEVE